MQAQTGAPIGWVRRLGELGSFLTLLALICCAGCNNTPSAPTPAPVPPPVAAPPGGTCPAARPAPDAPPGARARRGPPPAARHARCPHGRGRRRHVHDS